MAGTTRRSPFDQADDGHQVFSPLTNLVRKASRSQHSGSIPTLNDLASTPGRPTNMRSVSDDPRSRKKSVPPNLVLHGPPPSPGHKRSQPSSPLLHTRFRASVATSIASSYRDSEIRDFQELHYHDMPGSSGSDYTPSPNAHKPFAYIIDDTHAGGSPTSQYSLASHNAPPAVTGPHSPSLAQPFQFDSRTSVAPSDIASVAPPFQYDQRASSLTVSTDAPFQYDDSSLAPQSNNLASSMRASTRSSTAYNPRGTWRSSAAPDPDPFSFRDYEAPRVEPPIVVVHSPMSTIQDHGDEDVDGNFFLGERAGSSSSHEGPSDDLGSTSYDDAYEYVYGVIEADDGSPANDDQATETGGYFAPDPQSNRQSSSEYTEAGSYFTPEPVAALPAAMSKMSVTSTGGRVASITAGGARYNYSRPMRSGGGGSISGTGAIQPEPAQPQQQGGLSPREHPGASNSPTSMHSMYSEASASSSRTGSSGTSPARSPVRKGTGPLIFQSSNPSSPEGRDTEYPYRYSPISASTSDSQSPQSSVQYPSPHPPHARQLSASHSQPPNGSPVQRPPSLYSQYSFYSLPNSTPPESPHPGDGFSRQAKPKPSGSQLNPNTQGQRSGSPNSQQSKSTTPTKAVNTAAQHYLQLGISAHEQNNLRESARCFERSATDGGGCGVGMLMWGLSLRHGWGCRKDERTGFKWLRKAAEAAVADLEGARSGEEAKAVRVGSCLHLYATSTNWW